MRKHLVYTRARKAIALSATLLGLILGTSAHAQTKIVLGYVPAVTISYASTMLAAELGYFKEEGIDISFVEFKGSAVLLPQLVNKSVTIGYPNPDILILSRQPGRDPLPLKFFYNATPASVWEIAVPADSPIKTLADLKGKKVGVGSMTFGNIPITKALLEEQGFKIDKDIELVPVGIGGPAFLALKSGKIDALNLFDTQIALLEGTMPIRRLELPAKYVKIFSNGYIAHEDTIKNNPQLLAKFGRAASKGVVACLENMPACARNYWKYYPDQKPQGSDADVLKIGVSAIKVRLQKMTYPEGKDHKFAAFEAGDWNTFMDILKRGGQITDTNISPDLFFTNALVDDINKFDREKVRADARKLP
jgi:NitT/TauT family transport system substrate-binding protein